MRPARALIAAFSVALAIGASVGAAPAFAEGTVLCKADEEECAKENVYPLTTELGTALEPSTSLTFSTSVYTVQCPESTLGLSLLEETAEALIGQVEDLRFFKCTTSGKDCANESWDLPWRAEFQSQQGEGKREEWVVFSDGGGGEPAIKIECALSKEFIFKCVYAAEALEMPIYGGEPAKLSTNNASLSRVSGSEALCGKAMTWSAGYDLSPEPLYVTQH